MGVWLAVSVIRIVEKTGPKKGQTGGLNRPMALHVADSDQRCFLRKNPKSFTRRFFTHAGCTQLFSVSDRGAQPRSSSLTTTRSRQGTQIRMLESEMRRIS